LAEEIHPGPALPSPVSYEIRHFSESLLSRKCQAIGISDDFIWRAGRGKTVNNFSMRSVWAYGLITPIRLSQIVFCDFEDGVVQQLFKTSRLVPHSLMPVAIDRPFTNRASAARIVQLAFQARPSQSYCLCLSPWNSMSTICHFSSLILSISSFRFCSTPFRFAHRRDSNLAGFQS
jgi:hypothetical protein